MTARPRTFGITAASLLTIAALALVPAAFAAKGGGHKPGGGTSTNAALTGVVSSGSYTVTGTGFKPGEIVMLTIGEAGGCCNARNIVPDSTGGFAYVGQIWGSGVYTIRASEYINSRWSVVAQWSFTA
jgi:hypothetical protein